MRIEQIYTNCLAEAAYYIESNGEAAIIDPLRDTDELLNLAKKSGAKIKYIFETHFHADFVSGHLDLAKKTGAKIVYGPTAKAEYDIYVGQDYEIFKLGDVEIQLLHTPGHTMESSCFLLKDENGNNHSVFTGDTLFLGDVGRPDLAVKSDLTKEDLAGYLYESIQNKLLTLDDKVIIYPGHGAGSACGKNMKKETVGTLGEERNTNYALKEGMSKDEFVEEVLKGIFPPPQYFPKNAQLNKKGYESFDSVLNKGLTAAEPVDFQKLAEKHLILDTRDGKAYMAGHINGSLFVGLSGGFAPWVGTVVEDLNQGIIFICEEGKEEEVVTRLSRVGYDNIFGYLKGGFAAWFSSDLPIIATENIDSSVFETINLQNTGILDVRKPNEYQSQHVKTSVNLPLDFINSSLEEFSNFDKAYVYCAGGYRSLIAMSILEMNGMKNFINVNGGMKEILKSNTPVTEFVCPSTLV